MCFDQAPCQGGLSVGTLHLMVEGQVARLSAPLQSFKLNESFPSNPKATASRVARMWITQKQHD